MVLVILTSPVKAEDELPVRAKALVEEMDDYRRDITKKAQELIDAKLTKIKKGLEIELNRQLKSGNAEGARAIVAVVEKWNADHETHQREVEVANARWRALFQGESLPTSWTVAREGEDWEYSGGTLKSQSSAKAEGAVFLHKAEPGDIVIRGELQVINNGDPGDDHRVGIGFIDSKERTIIAYSHAPGTIFVHSSLLLGDGLLAHEKSSACQKKFSELQLAWVGTTFMLFVEGKLLIEQDIATARGGDDIALLTANAAGLFRNVGFRVPDSDDLKRLKSKKALK
ncbi:MAG: hypothetical protein GY899_07000 [Verrucomicrobiaceae bacterium]|nr:hypothetical protein [Verrucomicrobiaceae bacterium]